MLDGLCWRVTVSACEVFLANGDADAKEYFVVAPVCNGDRVMTRTGKSALKLTHDRSEENASLLCGCCVVVFHDGKFDARYSVCGTSTRCSDELVASLRSESFKACSICVRLCHNRP